MLFVVVSVDGSFADAVFRLMPTSLTVEYYTPSLGREVCVCERERESVVCVCERERESVCVCER